MRTKPSQRWRGIVVLFVAFLGRILRPFEGRMVFWAFCMPFVRMHPKADEAKILKDGERFEIEFSGQKIGGWRLGDGKKPVLLVHGWAGTSAQLALWIPGLLERGFSIVAIDMPAHGVSPGLRTSLKKTTDALVAIGKEVGPLSGIIAHSYGGATVSRALQLGLQAERMIAIAPPNGPKYFFERMLRLVKIPKKRWPGIHKSIAKKIGVPMSDLDMGPIWSNLQTPLLVVHDRDDKEVEFKCHEEWLEAVPHAKGFTTEKLGHRRILRSPKVIEAGFAFLTEESVSAQEPAEEA
jgi:pimeloyl-ACP methyl ester carboxylesterase